MKKDSVESLRYISRKLIRELGILQLEPTDSDMSAGHWHALIEIERHPGITISQLSQTLLMPVSKVSRMTKMLGAKNFIALKEGLDKREKNVSISPEGALALKHIDDFSAHKIRGAFKFLKASDMNTITHAITLYAEALEKSRLCHHDVKIKVLSTSRTIRTQVVRMLEDIQKNEFLIPVTPDTNACVIKAEEHFYYNNTYNFWCAVNHDGHIVGCIGLKKIDSDYGELKKFFVRKDYRGTGVAKKLLRTLVCAAHKHGFQKLVLGSADPLKDAHHFYEKYGFTTIDRGDLPPTFDVCELDTVFCQGDVATLLHHVGS